MRRVLITGASGFVGSYLAADCVKRGDEVYGLMRRRAKGEIPRNIIERKLDREPNFHTVEGDLTDSTAVMAALSKAEPDVVFHLAAQAYVPRSFACPEETIRTNITGTLNLLEAVANNFDDFWPRVVFAGSSEEYGAVQPVDLPLDEDSPLNPVSPYAISKVAGDYLMRNYHKSRTVDAVVSRAFNHEGPGRGDMYVTSAIAKQARGELEMSLGNLNAMRDWSHVKDIVAGYQLLAEQGKAGEVYVQGAARTNSVLTFALMAYETVFNSPVAKIEWGSKTMREPLVGDELDHEIFEKWAETGEEFINWDAREVKVTMTSGHERKIVIHPDKYRPAEVPVLLSNPRKIRMLGAPEPTPLRQIVQEMVKYYDPLW